METIQIKLEKQLLDKALIYARQRGMDLSAILSDYLSRLVNQEDKKQEIPDIVQSLLGAGTPVAEDDLRMVKRLIINIWKKNTDEKLRRFLILKCSTY